MLRRELKGFVSNGMSEDEARAERLNGLDQTTQPFVEGWPMVVKAPEATRRLLFNNLRREMERRHMLTGEQPAPEVLEAYKAIAKSLGEDGKLFQGASPVNPFAKILEDYENGDRNLTASDVVDEFERELDDMDSPPSELRDAVEKYRADQAEDREDFGMRGDMSQAFDEFRAVADRFAKNEDGKLFQGAAVPDAKLYALHNMSADALEFTHEFGGLAVPSLAVTKQGIVHEGFGDITLIGTKDLADPSKVPVFSQDAYSQRFPDISWPKVKTKAAESFMDKFRPFAERAGSKFELSNEVWDALVNHPDRDKALETFAKSKTAMLAFLEGKGEKGFKPPIREVPRTRAWVDGKFRDEVAPLLNEFEDLPYDQKQPGNKIFDAIAKAADDAVQRYAEKHANGEDMSAAEYADLLKARDVGEDQKWGWAPLDHAIRDIDRLGKTEVDQNATEEQLRAKIQPHIDEYQKWVSDQIKPMFSDPSIKVGRKKVPFTLENVVEAMARTNVRNKEDTLTFGVGHTKAATAKQFRSFEEMRAAADSIVSREAGEAEHKHVDTLMEKFRDLATPHYLGTDYRGNIDTWHALDDAQRALAAAVKSGGSETAVRRGLEKYGFKDPSPETLKAGVEAAKALKTAVTEYFEAKPQRAVGLLEFAGAVIPKDAPERVRQILAEAGLPVREYDKASRSDVATQTEQFVRELNEKRGDVLFQEGDKPKRGYFDPNQKVIGLMKSADASTFLHESAHAWLQDEWAYVRSGKREPGVPQADWKTIADWLGVKEGQEKLTREQHETVRQGLRGLYARRAPVQGVAARLRSFPLDG
jgi:hypothetical protein